MTTFKNSSDRRSHRAVDEEAAALERRLHEYFRKFEGRSLADELIAERREEVHWEGGDLNPPCPTVVEKGGSDEERPA